MKVTQAASALKELGHPTRLSIFKLLVKSGHEGLPVGDLQASLDIPHSTLSHHLAKLISVKLVKQQREGRTLYCIPQYEILNQLLTFLSDECCVDEKQIR